MCDGQLNPLIEGVRSQDFKLLSCDITVVTFLTILTVLPMQGMPEWVDIVNELAPLDTFVSKLEK